MRFWLKGAELPCSARMQLSSACGQSLPSLVTQPRIWGRRPRRQERPGGAIQVPSMLRILLPGFCRCSSASSAISATCSRKPDRGDSAQPSSCGSQNSAIRLSTGSMSFWKPIQDWMPGQPTSAFSTSGNVCEPGARGSRLRSATRTLLSRFSFLDPGAGRPASRPPPAQAFSPGVGRDVDPPPLPPALPIPSGRGGRAACREASVVAGHPERGHRR